MSAGGAGEERVGSRPAGCDLRLEIADRDRERLVEGKPVAVRHPRHDDVPRRLLEIEEDAVRDGDVAGVVDGEPPAAVVRQGVGEGLAVGILAGDGADERSVGAVLGDRERTAGDVGRRELARDRRGHRRGLRRRAAVAQGYGEAAGGAAAVVLERDEVGGEIRLREACRRGAAPPDDAVRGPGDGVHELGRRARCRATSPVTV